MFSAHGEAASRRVPVAEVLGEPEQRRPRAHRGDEPARAARRCHRTCDGGCDRREPGAELRQVADAKAGSARSDRRAGLAGLRCAHLLWNANPHRIAATVFEANPDRIGGRCWTLRDYFGGGLITEHGGQFINSNQTPSAGSPETLGLTLEDVNGGNLPSGEEAYLIDGATYTNKEALADWESVGYRIFHDALREAETHSGAKMLDRISVTEWLEGTEIGTASRFGKLMLACSVAEQGGDPEEQSALLLIDEFGEKNTRRALTTGEGDERFHIVGGNDQW